MNKLKTSILLALAMIIGMGSTVQAETPCETAVSREVSAYIRMINSIWDGNNVEFQRALINWRNAVADVDRECHQE